VFPSIPRFEAEVVAMRAAMLGSKTKSSQGQVCGNMTSYGCEVHMGFYEGYLWHHCS